MNIYAIIQSICGSDVEPASSYQKVACSIPLVCMAECPKPAPDVLVRAKKASIKWDFSVRNNVAEPRVVPLTRPSYYTSTCCTFTPLRDKYKWAFFTFAAG